ncbi:MAG: YaiI/YqxD family protein [Candidatus Berkiellales bacterium]
MEILVDADACPNTIKKVLFRSALRLKIKTVLYANHTLTIPNSPFIKFIQVPGGFDVVDHKIVENVNSGDLVITADIPLAASVIEKHGFALNPRGELYTKENIQQRLTLRNFMEDLRSQGTRTSGPAPLHPRDIQAFANALDSFLAKGAK